MTQERALVRVNAGFTEPQRSLTPTHQGTARIMAPAPGEATRKQEAMRHLSTVWADPSHADAPLGAFVEKRVKHAGAVRSFVPGEVVREWVEWLESRPKPASPQTREKYVKSVASFCRSLADAGAPLTLGSVTPAAVGRWVKEQRRRGCAEEGIASRLAALKAFTRKFLKSTLELTAWDLLEKVDRLNPDVAAKARLTDAEIALVMDSFPQSYDGERDRTLVTVYLATGCRLSEILTLRHDAVDRLTGRFVVVGKGGKERPCKLGPEHLKQLRRWLRTRVAEEGVTALWTTAEGTPLTFWGAQEVFRRIRKRTGVKVHAHLLRHTYAQHALERGAERAAVQDILGHSSDAMLRRYSALARASTAAEQMPKWAAV